VAIHLAFSVDCRSRQASFAMTNLSSLAGAHPVRQAQGPEPVEGLDCRALVPRARNDKGRCVISGLAVPRLRLRDRSTFNCIVITAVTR
jgi:hypothetical protein